MKKLIVGVLAVGAVLALRPALRRQMAQRMREHCTQMAAQCKEMMGAQPRVRDEASPMPEQEAPHFVSRGEAVAV